MGGWVGGGGGGVKKSHCFIKTIFIQSDLINRSSFYGKNSTFAQLRKYPVWRNKRTALISEIKAKFSRPVINDSNDFCKHVKFQLSLKDFHMVGNLQVFFFSLNADAF